MSETIASMAGLHQIITYTEWNRIEWINYRLMQPFSAAMCIEYINDITARHIITFPLIPCNLIQFMRETDFPMKRAYEQEKKTTNIKSNRKQ